MSEKPPSSRNAPPEAPIRRSYDPLAIALWLFAIWAASRVGIRLFFSVRAALQGLHSDLLDRDFANYWVAGKLVRSGEYALLFDQAQYYQALKLLFGSDYQIHSWSYPPHFLMLVAPLGWLGYLPALALFLALTFGLFAWGTREFVHRLAPETRRARLWLTLTGFVLAMVDATQNGFLTSAMLLFTLAFMRERPALAGFALALLTTKPQLGFLVPLLALYDRNWALLRWATIFTTGLVGASLAWFGMESWTAYFDKVLPYQQLVMSSWEGGFLWMMPTTFGSGRLLGLAPSAALAMHALVAAAALSLLLLMLRRLQDPLERAFAVLAATFLVTPYAFNYDMGAFCVAAACLTWRREAAGSRARAWIFAAAATLPAYILWLAYWNLPLSPVVIAAAFLLPWSAQRERRASPVTPS